ncbi:hypothetical protein POTOM_058434 [Populus tomentosa]|uniref:Uncharacterized protein n=1 Tax=Populus tomentosa TaxID=118781 RepID=A0A8X7XXR2_POPTO|nr:hypothetical protein POTOM_058434 [Populus tomentosa]
MKLLLIFISILLIQAFVGNSILSNAASSSVTMDEESDVVAIDKKHYPKRISKFGIVVIYAQGDAGHRQERRYATEHARLAATDAGAFHQVSSLPEIPDETQSHLLQHVLQALTHIFYLDALLQLYAHLDLQSGWLQKTL